MVKKENELLIVNVKFEENKVDEIDEFAKHMTISRSDFIRLACNEFIRIQQLKAKELGVAS